MTETVPTVEGVCPNCGHVIVIPKSVKRYKCICGKEYNIVIVERKWKDETSSKESLEQQQ
jgi:ribosomal protein S27AE